MLFRVRRAALAMSLVAGVIGGSATRAHAYVVQVPVTPPPPADDGDFWHRVLQPHAVEVDQITAIVQAQVIAPLEAQYGMGVEINSEQRTKVLQAALVKLKHARKLAPDNTTVLAQLGRVADELGQTRQAIEALQTCIDLEGPDKAGAEVTGQLGMIYLRLGDLDDAIRYLRLAEAPPTTSLGGAVLIDLSNALALRGQMNDAIDVLARAMPASYDYNAEQWGIAFALAVQYDRDDQRAAAFQTLDKLQALLQDQTYGTQLQSWFGSLRFTPAEDQHYYSGLLYESLGEYSEARAEWALYAASGGAFRGRALEHVAAIDAQRRAAPGHPSFDPPAVVPTRSIYFHPHAGTWRRRRP